MTIVVQSVAALALVAALVSAVAFIAFRLADRRIESLAPKAQARLYLVASVTPVLVSLSILAAALAPSFGWIADHCFVAVDSHAHPHICGHHVPVGPARAVLSVAVLLFARASWVIGRQVYAVLVGWRARRTFEDTSTVDGDVRVLPVAASQAFVLGLLRPALFITRGLTDGADRRHLGAVVAHERAHVERRDPLRRFFAALAGTFHLPGIAGWFDRRLARAQEMAADDLAAQRVGYERVAQALVALARSRFSTPAAALTFTGSDLEHRVRRLLDPRTRRDAPSSFLLAAAAVATLALVAATADTVHHAVEIALGILGG